MIDSRVSLLIALLTFVSGLFFATFSGLQAILPAMLRGGIVTLQVSAAAAVVFVAAAFIAGIARTAKLAVVRYAAGIYVEVFRGTSLLVQLFWLFFVLPEFGITLTPLVAAVLAVGLNYGAYGAEIVRGSFNAIPKGQWEAGRALNIRPDKQLIRIILPQAMIAAVPSMGNLLIELVKATSLVSAVTLVDLTYASVQQNQLHYKTIEIFSVSLMLYYIISQTIRLGISLLEVRIMKHLPTERP